MSNLPLLWVLNRHDILHKKSTSQLSNFFNDLWHATEPPGKALSALGISNEYLTLPWEKHLLCFKYGLYTLKDLVGLVTSLEIWQTVQCERLSYFVWETLFTSAKQNSRTKPMLDKMTVAILTRRFETLFLNSEFLWYAVYHELHATIIHILWYEQCLCKSKTWQDDLLYPIMDLAKTDLIRPLTRLFKKKHFKYIVTTAPVALWYFVNAHGSTLWEGFDQEHWDAL